MRYAANAWKACQGKIAKFKENKGTKRPRDPCLEVVRIIFLYIYGINRKGMLIFQAKGLQECSAIVAA